LTNKIEGVIADHLVHPNHVKADGLHFLIPPSCWSCHSTSLR